MYNLLLGIALFLAFCGIVFIIVYFAMRQYSVPRPAIPPVKPEPQGIEPPRTAVKTAHCPWCGSAECSDSNPFLACSACGSVQHRKCWDLYGGCSTFDCQCSPVSTPVSAKAIR